MKMIFKLPSDRKVLVIKYINGYIKWHLRYRLLAHAPTFHIGQNSETHYIMFVQLSPPHKPVILSLLIPILPS